MKYGKGKVLIEKKKATNALRSIGRIRKYLTNENLKELVNAHVISRLNLESNKNNFEYYT